MSKSNYCCLFLEKKVGEKNVGVVMSGNSEGKEGNYLKDTPEEDKWKMRSKHAKNKYQKKEISQKEASERGREMEGKGRPSRNGQWLKKKIKILKYLTIINDLKSNWTSMKK